MTKSVSIDARMIHTSGIGTYLRHVVPGIIEDLSDTRFYLLGDAQELSRFQWTDDPRVDLIDFKDSIYSVNEQFSYLRKIPSHVDLHWQTHFNIPLFYRKKLLVTVYDAFFLAMPELVGGKLKLLYAKYFFSQVAKRASSILTISEFTKSELVRLAGISDQKIYPIHLGIDESWFQVRKKKRPHDKPYLLFVGNVKPHKNLRRLVEAFEIIKDQIPHDLIVVGKKEGFITSDPESIRRSRRLQGRVMFTGHVDEDSLRQYYAHADAFLFPSLYEGFGFPPLEAMACGCPTVVAKSASLPEVCGDASLYCNPHDVNDMADKIKSIATNPILAGSLKAKGVTRAKSFAWDVCIHHTAKTLRWLIA